MVIVASARDTLETGRRRLAAAPAPAGNDRRHRNSDSRDGCARRARGPRPDRSARPRRDNAPGRAHRALAIARIARAARAVVSASTTAAAFRRGEKLPAGRGGAIIGRQWQPECAPAPQPAVEHRDVRMAQPFGGHPPEARCPHASRFVVGKQQRVVVDAPRAQSRGKGSRGRATDDDRCAASPAPPGRDPGRHTQRRASDFQRKPLDLRPVAAGRIGSRKCASAGPRDARRPARH